MKTSNQPLLRTARHAPPESGDVLPKKMNKEQFHKHLTESVRLAIETARRYVKQELLGDVVFDVYANQSYDGNPLAGDEQVFPADSDASDNPLRMETKEQVVEFLWRDGKVPEWIDINVASATKEETHLRLLCCGRFTAKDKMLYHRQAGIPPFSVKSPYLPPDYDVDSDAEPETRRFDVNWLEKRRAEP